MSQDKAEEGGAEGGWVDRGLGSVGGSPVRIKLFISISRSERVGGCSGAVLKRACLDDDIV